MSQASRDENFVPTLLAVSSTDGTTPVTVYADPTSHRLLVGSTLNNPRVTTVNAPGATPSTNSDSTDIANFTGLAVAITSMTTNLSGTPNDGQKLEFRFLDNGTGRAITWGASFAATTVALPTTTILSTCLRAIFEWRAASSKWECILVA